MVSAFVDGPGGRLAVDFGFGAFLDKIEEHFGKRVLKALLILIGLAVALFCGKMIWEIALAPLVSFAVHTASNGEWIQALAKVFWNASAFAAGIGLASLIWTNFLSWRDYKKGQELLHRSDKILLRSDKLQAALEEKMADVNEINRQSGEILSNARDLIDKIKATRDFSDISDHRD